MLQSLAQSLVKSLGTTEETLLLMMIGTEGEEVRCGGKGGKSGSGRSEARYIGERRRMRGDQI